MRSIYLFLFAFLISCKTQPSSEVVRPVKAFQVQESSLEDSQLEFPGTLRALNRANLSFRVDGTVIKRDIIVGQKAKKDEVLIQLDPRDYKVALNRAKGQVDSTIAQLDFALRDFERMKNIYTADPGAISVSLLDRKLEATNRLKGELSIAQSEVDKASDNLTYTTLRAPFDGIIAAIYVQNHEQVKAKQTAVRFIDIAETEMEINVPEKFVKGFFEGKSKLKFDVILDTLPNKVFPASIKEIGTEASSITQTYPVILSIKDIPLEQILLAGMNGKAILQLTKQHTANAPIAYKVPKSAVYSDSNGNTFVWVIDQTSQTVHKQPIKLEQRRQDSYALVLEGIAKGEWVVSAGGSFLSEGQKVKFSAETPGT